jgi:GNAT superfamily N-acetyltransferase
MGLETGWDPATPRNDTVLRTAVLGHADAFEHVVLSRGGSIERDHGLSLADSGSPSFFFNTALVLQPPGEGGIGPILDRVERFFAARPGGGVLFLSPWPFPPVTRPQWELLGHPPIMFRPAGTAGPAALPTDARIDEVADDELLSAFEAVLVNGFPMVELQPPFPGSVLDGRVLDSGRFHCWVASVERRPVAASAAYFADDLVLVTWVATLEEFRGRGYGAAVTWAAVREAPRLPAALLASDLGRPVYQRLGFLPLIRLTALHLKERVSAS